MSPPEIQPLRYDRCDHRASDDTAQPESPSDQEEQRKHQGELDELGALVAREPAVEIQRSHIVATIPVKIGNAYASLGPALFSSVISRMMSPS